MPTKIREIRHPWLLLGVVTVIGLAADLVSKLLAEQWLPIGQPRSCLGKTLELMLIYNRAGVFGIDPGNVIPGFHVQNFFPFFNLVAALLLLVYYRFLKRSSVFMHWALAFVMPGALGNLLDRIIHPARGVVDFIKVDLGFPPFHPWPIFNLADAWVTIGIILMAVSFLFEEQGKKNASEAAIPATPPVTGERETPLS